MDDIIRVTTTTDIMFGKPHPTKVGTRTEITGAEDKRILFAALPKLSAAQIAANLSLVSPTYGQLSLRPGEFPGHHHMNHARCNTQKLIWITNHGTNGVKSLSVQQQYEPPAAMGLDPLQQATNVVGWEHYRHGVCASCLQAALD